MTTILNMTRDINGYNSFGVVPADDKVSTKLSAGVEQTTTVPSNYQNWLAIFQIQSGNDIYIANNATATVPGGSFAATASELNPPAWQVKGGDVLHFITNQTTAEITVKYYAIN